MKTIDPPSPAAKLLRQPCPPELADLSKRCQHSCLGGWHSTSLPCSDRRAAILCAIGSFGLWKLSADGNAVEFAYPASILAGVDAGECDDFAEAPANFDPPANRQEAMLAWAVATAGGRLVPEWTPPSEEMLSGFLPRGRRSIRHGSIIREIEVIHEPGHFALRVQLASLDPEMPGPRRLWVQKFIASANRIWRLVRIGIAPDSRSVTAEVDLTGVPAAVFSPLFQASIDSLRWIVASLAETMIFLAQTESSSRALEVLPAE